MAEREGYEVALLQRGPAPSYALHAGDTSPADPLFKSLPLYLLSGDEMAPMADQSKGRKEFLEVLLRPPNEERLRLKSRRLKQQIGRMLKVFLGGRQLREAALEEPAVHAKRGS